MHDPLGKTVTYKDTYDPSVLFAIPRALGRELLGLSDQSLPFEGVDNWRAYEFTWLNKEGKPQVAILDLAIPSTSTNLIESKSLKLYLGSFWATSFDSINAVETVLKKDVEKVLDTAEPMKLKLWTPNEWNKLAPVAPPNNWLCIDDMGRDIKEVSNCTIYSNLFRSVCPVTHQPDYATVVVSFKGTIIPQKLLAHIISLRTYQAFHEQCCEELYLYLQSTFHLTEVSITCLFTRRGGIEICPIRSTTTLLFPVKTIRTIRQ